MNRLGLIYCLISALAFALSLVPFEKPLWALGIFIGNMISIIFFPSIFKNSTVKKEKKE